ncbi:hypothetical protein [Wukongibacter sp. M2B1]|uniref:hypothetical protein n=1 Tax=Wukongibacter sp. M2B1 TaxID=3088895 RepID=UPI003D7A7A95
MLDRKIILYLIFFIMFLSILSGVITYTTVGSRNNKKPVVETKVEENQKNIELIVEQDNRDRQMDFSMKDIFNEIENIYIKNYAKQSSVIELKGKERSVLVANFKALQKEKIEISELKGEMIDFELYDYEIDVFSKNIKIKLYNQIEYMVIEEIESVDEMRYVYKLNEEELRNFIILLEDMYIDKLIEKIVYPISDKVYLSAKDENTMYVMNKKETKELISKLEVLSIEDQEQYIGTPTIYPSYEIIIKRDPDYKFYFKNHEIMIIDTPIVYLYCKYDKKLWDYIVEKLPKENSAKENDLRFLLKADKVIVKDLDGTYDLENSSYYNIELPRQILKSKPKEIEKSSDGTIEEDLRFVLKFSVDGRTKEVLIYNNYIIYEDNVYYSKNIYEHIKATLMLP